jgi:hypothetical protein
MILSVVLFGYETWPVALRQERRWTIFDNRMRRRIFGPKRAKVTGDRKKLNSEEFHLVFFTIRYLGDEIKEDEIGGKNSAHERVKFHKKCWLESLKERKRPYRRRRHRWDDIIKFDLGRNTFSGSGLNS